MQAPRCGSIWKGPGTSSTPPSTDHGVVWVKKDLKTHLIPPMRGREHSRHQLASWTLPGVGQGSAAPPLFEVPSAVIPQKMDLSKHPHVHPTFNHLTEEVLAWDEFTEARPEQEEPDVPGTLLLLTVIFWPGR